MNVRMVTVAVLALSGTAIAQMSKDDKQWLEHEVSAIATAEESSLYRSLPTDLDRELFRDIFWKRRDPDVDTEENEFRDRFYQRVALADERFRGRVGPGSRSEMGQIFLLFGFPASIDTGRAVIPLDSGREDGAKLEGSVSEEMSAAGAGASEEALAAGPRFQTWVYPPNEALGIPDGLSVKFRSQPGYGYRLVQSDEVERSLELTRQGVIAQPQIGYRLDPEGHLVGLQTEVGASQILEELMVSGKTSDAIPFAVTPSFFPSREGTSVYVPVLLELPDAKLSFDGGTAGVTFFGAIADESGPIQRFEEKAALTRGNEAFEVPLQLEPGDYIVYLGVMDDSDGRAGSRVATLQVPEFDPEEFTLSSVVLHTGATSSEKPAGVPGNAFQFAGIDLVPRAARPFTRSQSLGIFFYVYGAASDANSGEGKLTSHYKLFRDGQERAQTRPRPLISGSALAIASDAIPLESFEPGDYQLAVHVTDEMTGKTLDTRVSFRLEP